MQRRDERVVGKEDQPRATDRSARPIAARLKRWPRAGPASTVSPKRGHRWPPEARRRRLEGGPRGRTATPSGSPTGTSAAPTGCWHPIFFARPGGAAGPERRRRSAGRLLESTRTPRTAASRVRPRRGASGPACAAGRSTRRWPRCTPCSAPRPPRSGNHSEGQMTPSVLVSSTDMEAHRQALSIVTQGVIPALTRCASSGWVLASRRFDSTQRHLDPGVAPTIPTRTWT